MSGIVAFLNLLYNKKHTKYEGNRSIGEKLLCHWDDRRRKRLATGSNG